MSPIKTTKRIGVPESEMRFSFARSGGKGGQNINKVETKVVLRWNLETSTLLTLEEKKRVRQYAPLVKRMDGKKKIITLYEQSQRSQAQNRALVVSKLNQFINEALTPRKPRIPTRIPRSAEEKRLREKKIQSEKKTTRQKPQDFNNF